MQRYRRKPDQFVVAVPLALATDGFDYAKWGDKQHCKAGDYLVDNHGDVYSVDREVFERTYRMIARGHYLKVTPVWAEAADRAGSVKTREGVTHYESGDYLVSNDDAGTDRYAVSRAKFEEMYELDDGATPV